MKSVVVLLALVCYLAISATTATPLPNPETKSPVVIEARQAAAAPAAPAAASSDDDDDDDDDDVDLDITGEEDDDDDDDDDEGDDEDYIEQAIADFLGDSEDDDDDEAEKPSAGSTVTSSGVVQQVDHSANVPSIPLNVQQDLASQNSASPTANDADASFASDEVGSSNYEDEDAAPEGQAASAAGSQDATIEGAESVSNPILLQQNLGNDIAGSTGQQQQPAVAASEAEDDDEDEDDDDDEDEDLDLTADDDDDEDEDEDEGTDEEDDDDEDDIEGLADIASARRDARAMGSGATVTSGGSSDVSAIYVAKYNRFVDTILGRINKILKEKYDPVTVKLSNPSSSSKSKKAKSSSSKSKRRKSSNKRGRLEGRIQDSQQLRDLVQNSTSSSPASSSAPGDDSSLDAATITSTSVQQQSLPETGKASITTLTPSDSTTAATTTSSELATRLVTNQVSGAISNRGSNSKRKKNKTRASSTSGSPTKNKTKAKKPSSSNSNSSSTNKAKPAASSSSSSSSSSSKRPRSKAKATLYGLSSLKRSGDVSVNMMSEHTTIRTKFNLGPLVLKVEKEFGRSTRKEVRSATATTAEMSGRLSLRVYHGGAATLHSIRVLQPKQMRIESADDHDRTREFVWKRSSHIAHVVSQKLSSAARSMLRPAPAA